jgi:hypothetical protein
VSDLTHPGFGQLINSAVSTSRRARERESDQPCRKSLTADWCEDIVRRAPDDPKLFIKATAEIPERMKLGQAAIDYALNRQNKRMRPSPKLNAALARLNEAMTKFVGYLQAEKAHSDE